MHAITWNLRVTDTQAGQSPSYKRNRTEQGFWSGWVQTNTMMREREIERDKKEREKKREKRERKRESREHPASMGQ